MCVCVCVLLCSLALVQAASSECWVSLPAKLLSSRRPPDHKQHGRVHTAACVCAFTDSSVISVMFAYMTSAPWTLSHPPKITQTQLNQDGDQSELNNSRRNWEIPSVFLIFVSSLKVMFKGGVKGWREAVWHLQKFGIVACGEGPWVIGCTKYWGLGSQQAFTASVFCSLHAESSGKKKKMNSTKRINQTLIQVNNFQVKFKFSPYIPWDQQNL